MKRIVCMLLLLAAFSTGIHAQTTRPTSPTRTYWINAEISGNSDDTQGGAYILLHKSYDNALMDGCLVMGKITGIRGHMGAWNRKWTVEVNTASAYNSDRGSLISYNEPASLVTLRYNGVRYLAVTIANSSMLTEFSFTGYVQAPTLQLVKATEVTEVRPFEHYEPVAAPGGIAIEEGNLGIGVQDTKGYRLAIAGNMIAEKIVIKNQQRWPDYVFAKDYSLPSLQELEVYINQHQHLPDMPSAETVKEKGVDLEVMNSSLLRKVEELTLYLIRLDKENKELKAEVNAIRACIRKP